MNAPAGRLVPFAAAPLDDAMRAALRKLGEADPAALHPPASPSGAVLLSALWRLEGHGLACSVGGGRRRGWGLTPAGRARLAELLGARR